MVRLVTPTDGSLCVSEKLLIRNKYMNKAVTEQQVIDLHMNYLNELADTYQAQPRDHDEWTRYIFISKMISSYPLFVDGSMLWYAIPSIPEGNDRMRQFTKNVLDLIEETYDCLSKNNIALDIVSILHILYEMMKRKLFKDALNWVLCNVNVRQEDITFPAIIDI